MCTWLGWYQSAAAPAQSDDLRVRAIKYDSRPTPRADAHVLLRSCSLNQCKHAKEQISLLVSSRRGRRRVHKRTEESIVVFGCLHTFAKNRWLVAAYSTVRRVGGEQREHRVAEQLEIRTVHSSHCNAIQEAQHGTDDGKVDGSDGAQALDSGVHLRGLTHARRTVMLMCVPKPHRDRNAMHTGGQVDVVITWGAPAG